MPKTTFLIFLIILSVGFLYWIEHSNEILTWIEDRPQNELPDLKEISNINKSFQVAQNTPPSDKPQIDPQITNDSLNPLLNEVATLEQQLDQARLELETRRETIENIKQNLESHEQSLSGSSTVELNTTLGEIQNLDDELETARLAENDITQNAEATLREQSRASQVERDQIEENIRSLQQSVQQTVRDINYWNKNFYDMTAREVRLNELQSQLAAQNQELENLRNQKIAVSSQMLNLTQNIDNLVQQQKLALIENQNVILDEIVARRAEILRIQKEDEEAQTNFESLNSQILQAQKSYNEQLQRVRQLEKTLQERKQQLNPS